MEAVPLHRQCLCRECDLDRGGGLLFSPGNQVPERGQDIAWARQNVVERDASLSHYVQHVYVLACDVNSAQALDFVAQCDCGLLFHPGDFAGHLNRRHGDSFTGSCRQSLHSYSGCDSEHQKVTEQVLACISNLRMLATRVRRMEQLNMVQKRILVGPGGVWPLAQFVGMMHDDSTYQSLSDIALSIEGQAECLLELVLESVKCRFSNMHALLERDAFDEHYFRAVLELETCVNDAIKADATCRVRELHGRIELVSTVSDMCSEYLQLLGNSSALLDAAVAQNRGDVFELVAHVCSCRNELLTGPLATVFTLIEAGEETLKLRIESLESDLERLTLEQEPVQEESAHDAAIELGQRGIDQYDYGDDEDELMPDTVLTLSIDSLPDQINIAYGGHSVLLQRDELIQIISAHVDAGEQRRVSGKRKKQSQTQTQHQRLQSVNPGAVMRAMRERARLGMGFYGGKSTNSDAVRLAFNDITDVLVAMLKYQVARGRAADCEEALELLGEYLMRRFGLGEVNKASELISTEVLRHFFASKKNWSLHRALSSIVAIASRKSLEFIGGKPISQQMFWNARCARAGASLGTLQERPERTTPISLWKKLSDVFKIGTRYLDVRFNHLLFDVSGRKGSGITRLLTRACGLDPRNAMEMRLKEPYPAFVSKIQEELPTISASFIRSCFSPKMFTSDGMSSGHCDRCNNHFYIHVASLREYVAQQLAEDVRNADWAEETLLTLERFVMHLQHELSRLFSWENECPTHSLAHAYGVEDSLLDPKKRCESCALILKLDELLAKRWLEWPEAQSGIMSHFGHLARTVHQDAAAEKLKEGVKLAPSSDLYGDRLPQVMYANRPGDGGVLKTPPSIRPTDEPAEATSSREVGSEKLGPIEEDEDILIEEVDDDERFNLEFMETDDKVHVDEDAKDSCSDGKNPGSAKDGIEEGLWTALLRFVGRTIRIHAIIDDATKWLPMWYRESKQDFFGKKGNPHRGVFLYYSDPDSGELLHVSYHVISDELLKQDNQSSLALVESVFGHLAETLLARANITALLSMAIDNGGAFKGQQFAEQICAGIYRSSNGRVLLMDVLFFEAGEGKSELDQMFSVFKRALLLYIRSGKKITTSDGFIAAMKLMGIPVDAILASYWFNQLPKAEFKATATKVDNKTAKMPLRNAWRFWWKHVLSLAEAPLGRDGVTRLLLWMSGSVYQDYYYDPVDENDGIDYSFQDWLRYIELSEKRAATFDKPCQFGANVSFAPVVLNVSNHVPLEIMPAVAQPAVVDADGVKFEIRFLNDAPTNCPACTASFAGLDGWDILCHIKACIARVGAPEFAPPSPERAADQSVFMADSVPSSPVESIVSTAPVSPYAGYACPVEKCGKRFAQRASVANHVILAHCQGKFYCKTCAKVFSSQSGASSCCSRLTAERVVPNSTIFFCPHCTKHFQRISPFNLHVTGCTGGARGAELERIFSDLREFVNETIAPRLIVEFTETPDENGGLIGLSSGHGHPRNIEKREFSALPMSIVLMDIYYMLGEDNSVARGSTRLAQLFVRAVSGELVPLWAIKSRFGVFHKHHQLGNAMRLSTEELAEYKAFYVETQEWDPKSELVPLLPSLRRKMIVEEVQLLTKVQLVLSALADHGLSTESIDEHGADITGKKRTNVLRKRLSDHLQQKFDQTGGLSNEIGVARAPESSSELRRASIKTAVRLITKQKELKHLLKTESNLEGTVHKGLKGDAKVKALQDRLIQERVRAASLEEAIESGVGKGEMEEDDDDEIDENVDLVPRESTAVLDALEAEVVEAVIDDDDDIVELLGICMNSRMATIGTAAGEVQMITIEQLQELAPLLIEPDVLIMIEEGLENEPKEQVVEQKLGRGQREKKKR